MNKKNIFNMKKLLSSNNKQSVMAENKNLKGGTPKNGLIFTLVSLGLAIRRVFNAIFLCSNHYMR